MLKKRASQHFEKLVTLVGIVISLCRAVSSRGSNFDRHSGDGQPPISARHS